MSVQSDEEEAEEVASPQPAIAEVKQAWIEQATRVGSIEGAQRARLRRADQSTERRGPRCARVRVQS